MIYEEYTKERGMITRNEDKTWEQDNGMKKAKETGEGGMKRIH